MLFLPLLRHLLLLFLFLFPMFFSTSASSSSSSFLPSQVSMANQRLCWCSKTTLVSLLQPGWTTSQGLDNNPSCPSIHPSIQSTDSPPEQTTDQPTDQAPNQMAISQTSSYPVTRAKCATQGRRWTIFTMCPRACLSDKFTWCPA